MAIVESMLVVVVVPAGIQDIGSFWARICNRVGIAEKSRVSAWPIDWDDPNAAFRPYPITMSGSPRTLARPQCRTHPTQSRSGAAMVAKHHNQVRWSSRET